MTKAMIFHYLLPINNEGTSGSQVRPFRMVKAFEKLGYQVELVTGYAVDRKKTIKRLTKEIYKGRKFDFVYSESLATPTLLAESHHFPLHPFLDFGFFKWLKKQSVPIGLFYRDSYWRFAEYSDLSPWYKRIITIPFYRYDWLQYLRLVDHLFLPSLAMKSILPDQWPDSWMSALPPGCHISGLSRPTADKASPDNLALLYVGGIKPPFYDIKPAINALENLSDVRLTLCCRASEWEMVQSYYAPTNPAQIRIVHAQGKELEAYYTTADIFILVRKEHPFSVIAMPVKVFEALQYGVPIITSAGTEVANFVEREGIGWVVSSKDEIRSLLSYLQTHPEKIAEKRQRIKVVNNRHTWLNRARTVAEILAKVNHKLTQAEHD